MLCYTKWLDKIVRINNLLYGKIIYDIEYNIALLLNKINNEPSIISTYNLSDSEVNELVHEKSKQINKFNLNQEQKQGIYEIYDNLMKENLLYTIVNILNGIHIEISSLIIKILNYL